MHCGDRRGRQKDADVVIREVNKAGSICSHTIAPDNCPQHPSAVACEHHAPATSELLLSC
eukprot:COSAG01_NODE_10301_length_2198_cov_1.201525_3_plen_59_part_01